MSEYVIINGHRPTCAYIRSLRSYDGEDPCDCMDDDDDRCICGTPGTGNFDGPLRDCPVHGEP